MHPNMDLFFKRKLLLALLLTMMLCACSQKPSRSQQDPSIRDAKILVSGTINLAKEVRQQANPLSVLFITARNEAGQIVAVKKLLPPFEYPIAFALSEQDVMIAGTEIPKKLQLTARLDQDGNANPLATGDIVNQVMLEVNQGNQKVRIIMDELIQ